MAENYKSYEAKYKIASVDEYFEIGCMRCALGATAECKVQKWSSDLKT